MLIERNLTGRGRQYLAPHELLKADGLADGQSLEISYMQFRPRYASLLLDMSAIILLISALALLWFLRLFSLLVGQLEWLRVFCVVQRSWVFIVVDRLRLSILGNIGLAITICFWKRVLRLIAVVVRADAGSVQIIIFALALTFCMRFLVLPVVVVQVLGFQIRLFPP